jgi:hypothetical protein
VVDELEHRRLYGTVVGRKTKGTADMILARILVRPFGYLAYVVALAVLSAAARLLGDKDELGFFAERLARMLWRYPEVTRKGIQMAWVLWAVLFAIALSPVDPIATPWDEAALAATALVVVWRRFVGGDRAER